MPDTGPPSDTEPVTDSPYADVLEHVQRYLATDGRSGHYEAGVPNLLLTTRGRRSGRLRRTAVFYTLDDGRYVLIASHAAGGPRHPAWYLNLVAEPRVTVQAGAEVFTARARTAVGAEKQRLWRRMNELFPGYQTYQDRTDRDFPVVVLEREDATAV
jgi:F420H(2)-dependent quinone reductase